MSDIVIKAENLGKSYIIGHEKRERYTALRDVMVNKVKNIAGKTRQIFKGGQLIAGDEMEEFWALRDLNFEIRQGDRLGIIGRNGAGKSTLLKVLSRITEPTTGKVTIHGRVASLLEVGTGFHPELTGRENIFLNGAILGMSRVEIRKRFDEIVDFSGVEKFLDTPVKRYSSGMYVRLAFAVAAHLEPEILVVDEVLAVGDAEFQKKCLGKMEDVSVKEGRTVLFVSHNMEAVKNLCNTGVLLNMGIITTIGKMEVVIDKYLNNESYSQASFDLPKPLNIEEIPGFAYKLQVENQNGQPLNEIPIGEPWQLRVFFKIITQVNHLIVGIGMQTSLGIPIRSSWSQPLKLQKGNYEVVFKESKIHFSPGKYQLLIGLSEHKVAFQYLPDAATIHFSEASISELNNRIVNTQNSILINQMEVELVKS